MKIYSIDFWGCEKGYVCCSRGLFNIVKVDFYMLSDFNRDRVFDYVDLNEYVSGIDY